MQLVGDGNLSVRTLRDVEEEEEHFSKIQLYQHCWFVCKGLEILQPTSQFCLE
jgi:hypothetical protein